MTEQIIISAFIFILGAQVGRVLTLNQQYRKTVAGIKCLLDAEWPQAKAAAHIHEDQNCTGDLPERIPTIKTPPLPAWVGNIYDRKPWRAPRIRRAANG
jgi:hypothetical protein